MIITLEETKQWIRVDGVDEDAVISILIIAAEKYLTNASGNVFTSSNELAKLLCFVLVADWYENREMIGQASGKVRLTVESILAQLSYAIPNAPTGLEGIAGDTVVDLSWIASKETDLVGYNIYQDSVKLTLVTEATYQATGLTNGTKYSFQISAVDKAGNESELSKAVSVTPTI
jgi:uncharacterized phage protein (predicted DNA packaging)